MDPLVRQFRAKYKIYKLHYTPKFIKTQIISNNKLNWHLVNTRRTQTARPPAQNKRNSPQSPSQLPLTRRFSSPEEEIPSATLALLPQMRASRGRTAPRKAAAEHRFRPRKKKKKDNTEKPACASLYTRTMIFRHIISAAAGAPNFRAMQAER